MRDFKNGIELLQVCREEKLPISAVMKQRELMLEPDQARTEEKMRRVLEIMKAAAHQPIAKPEKSMSGLIGGEAQRVSLFGASGRELLGPLVNKVLAYSMAVLEVNASMGVIVAAPTAGSSGVLPGVMLALQEEKNLTDEVVCQGIYNAAAIGNLLMSNASVAGAEAGCQAEIGSASAMAASAVVEVMGGTPQQCLMAASMALANMLGLVCDPICGLVEIPCQSRNASGAVNALVAAELILAGVRFVIPFDEMVSAMLKVGKALPDALRETAMGGCAATLTGKELHCRLFS